MRAANLPDTQGHNYGTERSWDFKLAQTLDNRQRYRNTEKNGNRQRDRVRRKTAATTVILRAQQGSFSQSLSWGTPISEEGVAMKRVRTGGA